MDRYEAIKQEYINGKSLRQIAKDWHICRQSLSERLKKDCVTIRDNSINSRKYFVDETYFSDINSDDKAYWLGFMYTDGFIESKRSCGNQKFGITVSYEDREHLVKFAKCLKSNYEVKDYKGSGFNKNGMFSRLLITSQKMVEDLKKYGCNEHKTKTLKWPTNLNPQFNYSFIRGLLDGDGTVSPKSKNTCARFSFLATYDLCLHIKEILHLDCSILKSKESDFLYVIRPGYLKYKDDLDKIYENASIYLDRKYRKYLLMLADANR